MRNKVDVPSLWSEQMGAVVQKQNELAANAFATDQSLSDLRAAYNTERAYWNEGGPRPYSSRDAQIATPFGSVRVRMHRPTEEETLPAIVFVHGGGWILGNLDTHDRITRALAEETGAAVIAVDYSLSPEAKYPQAIEETAAVVQELRSNPGEWGINPDDISFAGDSGGAHLSAATYLWLRDELNSADGIRALLLYYGYYGLRDSESFRLFGGEWDGLTEEDFAYFVAQYTNSEEDMSSPYVNILGNDLSGLPPAYIVSAALDPLRDDSRTLNAMLQNVGTATEYVEVPGVLHGFLHHSRMLDATLEVLRGGGEFYRNVPAPDTAAANQL